MNNSSGNDDIPAMNHSEEFKILLISTTYPFIHLKEKINKGNTILYYTTVNGLLEVFHLSFGRYVKKLKVEQKLRCLTSTGALGRTFLHSAANQGSLEVVKLVLDGKACPLLTGSKLFEFLTIKDELGYTALQLAVQFNHYDIVNYLLALEGLSAQQQFQHIAMRDEEGRTAFHLAAIYEHLDIIKLLLHKIERLGLSGNEILTVEDNFGFTAVQLALLNKHYQIAKFLLNEPPDGQRLNLEKLKFTLESSKLLVNDQEDSEYVKLCLEKILSVPQKRKMLTATDCYQRSVFHSAAVNNHLETLKLLLNDTTLSGLELKKILMLQDHVGFTSFHLAVHNYNWDTAKLLLYKIRKLSSFEELKTFFGLRNNLGFTVLHTAVAKGHYDTVKFLLEELTEAEEIFLLKDMHANTIFHLAIDEGHYDIVKLLLEFGKEILHPDQLNSLLLAKNNQNDTALHLAANQRNLKMVKLIFNDDTLSGEEQRTLLLATDYYDRTVVHSSARNNNQELLKFFLTKSKTVLSREDYKAILTLRDYTGFTSFHSAIRSGHYDIAKIFFKELKELQEIPITKSVHLNNVFYGTINEGHHDIIKLLINREKSELDAEDFRDLESIFLL